MREWKNRANTGIRPYLTYFYALNVGTGDHARQVRVYGQDTPVSVL